MIENKRKLFIQIGATAFKTSNEKQLDDYIYNFISKLTEEEVEYALSLFNYHKQK